MYYGIYTDMFSSIDVKCFIRKPIENEELIKRIHEIITTNYIVYCTIYSGI